MCSFEVWVHGCCNSAQFTRKPWQKRGRGTGWTWNSDTDIGGSWPSWIHVFVCNYSSTKNSSMGVFFRQRQESATSVATFFGYDHKNNSSARCLIWADPSMSVNIYLYSHASETTMVVIQRTKLPLLRQLGIMFTKASYTCERCLVLIMG